MQRIDHHAFAVGKTELGMIRVKQGDRQLVIGGQPYDHLPEHIAVGGAHKECKFCFFVDVLFPRKGIV